MGHALIIAAAAQAAAAAVGAPQPPERGVIAYPPSFFVEAQPTSAFDMVIRVPGFTFDKGASVRGLADAGGNVLIDGQPPVSKNDTLDELLKRIPATAVARVELIRGGAPGIDMQGKSVVVNVVRKTAGGFRAAVSPGSIFVYDGRVLHSLRAEAQWRWAGGRSAELSQLFGKGPNEELGDGIRTRFNANGTVRLRSDVDVDSGGQRIWTNGAYETPLFGGKARFTGAYLLNPSYVELYERYVGGGREYEYDRIDRRQIELGLRYSRPLTEQLTLESIAFHQDNQNKTYVHFEAPALGRDFRLRRNGEESVARVTFKYRRSANLFLEASAEGALNRLDSKTSLIVNTRPVVVPAANVQIEEKRAEATFRAIWQVAPTLTLEAGLRQERSTLTSDGDVTIGKTLQFTKPRLAATWAPSPVDQLRLRFEREVGQLNFDDFVATSGVASTGTLTAGNPDITPQQAWVAEAAYERRFWKSGAFVLTARHAELSDVVDRTPVFGPGGVILADSPGNIGNGVKDELLASLSLPLDRFGIPSAQLRLQGARRRTRVTDPVTGRMREISTIRAMADTRDVAPQAAATWEAHFTQDLPALKSVWGADLLGGYRERAYRLSEIESRKISAQLLLFLEYKARPDFTVRVEAQSINQRNAKRIRDVYIGPRNLGVHDFVDVRDLEWGGSLLIRLRKSFGG